MDWEALDGDVTEQFTPGTVIQTQDLFAGRKEQIRLLTDAVRRAGNHAVIYGEPGVGKSSLSNTFALKLNTATRPLVFQKVNADPDDTFTSLWKKVFKRLAYGIELDGGTVMRRISDDYQGEIAVDDVLIEMNTFGLNATPVVVIDEFQLIKDPQVSVSVANTIKGMADFAQNCTIVIVGVAENVGTLIAGHTSIGRQLIEVEMPRMSAGELGRIIKVRLDRVGMKIDIETLWDVAFLSRGLPYFTHLLGLHLARQAIEKRTLVIGPEHLSAAIKAALGEMKQTLSSNYAAATLTKKKVGLFEPVLLACALAEADEWGRFSQGSVEQPLFDIVQAKRYKATTYAFQMNSFCTEKRASVLERLGVEQAPRYRFSDPMMQPFVILRGISEGRIDEAMRKRFTPSRPASFSTEIEQPS